MDMLIFSCCREEDRTNKTRGNVTLLLPKIHKSGDIDYAGEISQNVDKTYTFARTETKVVELLFGSLFGHMKCNVKNCATIYEWERNNALHWNTCTENS